MGLNQSDCVTGGYISRYLSRVSLYRRPRSQPVQDGQDQLASSTRSLSRAWWDHSNMTTEYSRLPVSPW